MNDKPLIHWGIPGMKWGVRRRSSKTKGYSKQSNLARSLQQKYGHETVSSLLKNARERATKAAVVVVKAYAGYTLGKIIAGTAYNIANK